VNLLENAIRYTKRGQNISCTITNDASWLTVVIADTGIGIPKAEQDHLFKKFYRASNAREAVSAGTGIGLYICYQFVTAHKGTIILDSDLNKGTTFTIKLPLVTKDNITEFMIKS
jgi:signal transduction histidine kinase